VKFIYLQLLDLYHKIILFDLQVRGGKCTDQLSRHPHYIDFVIYSGVGASFTTPLLGDPATESLSANISI
jgi:hypothetical protein